MKKIIRVFAVIIFITVQGFGQNSQKKSLMLPKDVIEFGTDSLSAVSGPFARITEGGNINSNGIKYFMTASTICYGDNATAELALRGSDFKIGMEEEYNTNNNGTRKDFKVESYGGGTLGSWSATGEDIGSTDNKPDNSFYGAIFKWTGIIGACFIQLAIEVKPVEASTKTSEIKGNEHKAKARSYLEEMIAKVKKTDFTKL